MEEAEIVKKLCECGCGQAAPISKRNCLKQGYVKGISMRFIHGHGFIKNGVHVRWKGGLTSHPRTGILERSPNHPRAHCSDGDKRVYVPQHILIAEKALGKFLDRKHPIHHPTHNRFDNSSLVICENTGYHNLLHQRERAYLVCGHATWRKCQYCKKYAPLDILITSGVHIFHPECFKKHSHESYLSNKKYFQERYQRQKENAHV